MTNIVSAIYQEYLVSRRKNNTLPMLQTDFNPMITINLIRNHKFSVDSKFIYLNYTVITIVNLFTLSIVSIPLILKLVFVLFFILLLLIPITSQFFNGALPILTWVFLFFSSSKIPMSLRPPISVKVLPATETILYGDNLSVLLSSTTNTPLDIIAWIPYGILHFSLPFVVAFLIFIFAPPGTLSRFAFAFGYTNLCGVIVQNLLFPAAPPWYKILHGLDKADYSMGGSPGGLGRIDKLLGVDLYTTAFSTSPLIFGAMPSLHSACSSMDALWLSWLFPKTAWLFTMYVIWLWFSTMYLTHHYFIDLVLGTGLAVFWWYWVSTVASSESGSGNGLPLNDQLCRWSYMELKFNSLEDQDPLNANNANGIDQFIINDDEDSDYNLHSGSSTPFTNDEDEVSGSLEMQDLTSPTSNN